MKKVQIFDTTLRDGEQGIGNLMSIDQKKQILTHLDSLGLDVIELGFPAASQEDLRWFKTASHLSLKTKIAAFSRLQKADLACAVEAIKGFELAQIQLLGIGSEIHLKHKRQMTLEEGLAELAESIIFLKEQKVNDIAVIFEDSTRASKIFLKKMIDTAIAHGATTITLADTLGGAIPGYIENLVRWTRMSIPAKIKIGVHCHNDLGLATANTLAAIDAGADMIQTTFGGIGERAGNCALEEISAVLHYKKEYYQASLNIPLNTIAETAHQIFSVLRKKIHDHKPLLGKHVFSTAAGIHQNGILKHPETYEYVKASDVGRELTFVQNRLSSQQIVKQTKFNVCAVKTKIHNIDTGVSQNGENLYTHINQRSKKCQ